MFPQVTWKGYLPQLKIKTQIRETFGYLNMQRIQLWSFPEPAVTLGERDCPEQRAQKHQAASDCSSDISTRIRSLQGATGNRLPSTTRATTAGGTGASNLKRTYPSAVKQLQKYPKPPWVAVSLPCLNSEPKASSLFNFSRNTGPPNKKMRKVIKN